jgi:hypothetical protein
MGCCAASNVVAQPSPLLEHAEEAFFESEVALHEALPALFKSRYLL